MQRIFSKPTLEIPDQIKLLQERGLIISSESQAAEVLERVLYYRMSGYFYPFLEPVDRKVHQFRPGVRFEDPVDLYKFDEQIRFEAQRILSKIEIAFRTRLCHSLSVKFGSHWYLDSSLFSHRFDRSSGRAYEHARLIEKVEEADEVFIRHYRASYDQPPQPPFWMAMEVLSFGTLSTLFSHLRKDAITLVADRFGVPAKVLVNWFHSMVILRNLCAHHSRVWNRKLTHRLKRFKKNQLIKGYWPDHPQSLYCHFLVMGFLCSKIEPGYQWEQKLKEIRKKFLKRFDGMEYLTRPFERHCIGEGLENYALELRATGGQDGA